MTDSKRTVFITITNQCNLCCSYCYESNKKSEHMTLDLALKIIDEEIKTLTPEMLLEIQLFGGEPFLNFPIIKQVVEYFEKKYSSFKNVYFFIPTNGTVLTQEMKCWCKNHTEFLSLGLSFDGTPQMNDINRSNSSALIDLDFFKNTYPHQSVKMTISQETLSSLAEGIIFLHEYGFKVLCNLAYGINWGNIENQNILAKELQKLIAYYMDHPEIEEHAILDEPISPIAYSTDKALRTCGIGNNLVAYDAKGNAFPCQLFMELACGKEKSLLSKNFCFNEDIIPDNLLDEKCVKCILKSVCKRCYGSNYISSGNIYHQDDNMCILIKIMYKARAYFKMLQYESGVFNDYTENEQKALLKSIVLIQKMLTI